MKFKLIKNFPIELAKVLTPDKCCYQLCYMNSLFNYISVFPKYFYLSECKWYSDTMDKNDVNAHVNYPPFYYVCDKKTCDKDIENQIRKIFKKISNFEIRNDEVLFEAVYAFPHLK